MRPGAWNFPWLRADCRGYGRQLRKKNREHPMEGVASRLMLIVATLQVGADPRNWVAFSEQVSTENQNHRPGLPITCVEIRLHRPPDLRNPVAVTVARGGLPPSRVAVMTTLKWDRVSTASVRCAQLGVVLATAAGAVSRTVAAVIRAPTMAARRIVAEIMVTPPCTNSGT
jgi:hypothetical protein